MHPPAGGQRGVVPGELPQLPRASCGSARSRRAGRSAQCVGDALRAGQPGRARASAGPFTPMPNTPSGMCSQPWATHEPRLERLEEQLEPLGGEAPEVPRVGVDGEEHQRADGQHPARAQHPVHLLHRPDRVGDVLERLEADDRADADSSAKDRAWMSSMRSTPGPSWMSHPMCSRAPKIAAQVGDRLLALGRPRADLHERLGDREVLGDVVREPQCAVPHAPRFLSSKGRS